jgi:hypothetical protein
MLLTISQTRVITRELGDNALKLNDSELERTL